MSPVVESLVRSKRCGGIYRKAILMAFASRCNDDGTGAYPSKVRLAEEIECSRQTIHDTIEKLTNEGFLKPAGYVRTGHGKVVRYDLHLPKIMCLPDAITPKCPDMDIGSMPRPSAQEQAANCPELGSEVPRTEQRTVQLVDTKEDILLPSSASADARKDAVDRILAVCGPGLADPARAPSVILTLTRRLSVWLERYDLVEDILPVVQAKTARPRQSPLRNFELLETDIAAHHAARTRPLPEIVHETTSITGGRGNGGAWAGGPGGNGSGGHSSRSGGQSRTGNLAASRAWVQRLREEAVGVSDEPEDGRDDWVA